MTAPAPRAASTDTNTETETAARAQRIQRATWTAIATNAVLSLAQVVVGIATHAFSLVADAAHTLADLITDLLVLLAGRKGAAPADRAHPYGHGRIETLVSLLLGASLLLVGAGFLWAAGMRLQNLGSSPAPLHQGALYMALITLCAKEALFRYTLAMSRRLQAPLLEANAWHARSDAASSLVVALGIAGSLAGYPVLEPLAAALVGFLISGMGTRLGMNAIRELIDTGLSEAQLTALSVTIQRTPGVIGLHQLRTRRMADRVLCDAHVKVAAHISVSEGHAISDRVYVRIRQAHPEIRDVLVHIDVEDDDLPSATAPLPTRREVVETLAGLLGAPLPADMHLTLHYLNGGIEVVVQLTDTTHLPADRNALKSRIETLLAGDPRYRAIDFFVHQAP